MQESVGYYRLLVEAIYLIVKIDITKAKKVPCGSVEDCNKRVINQYMHPKVIKSYQFVMLYQTNNKTIL